jgi:hypothetical protein
VQKQIGLVRLLGKFVGCGSEWNRYRGVLDNVKLERYQSAEITAVLVFKVPAQREIKLEMAQLTDGTAYCKEIKKGDLFVDEIIYLDARGLTRRLFQSE